MSVTDRPLRSDAERNRQRILDAARELFAQRGLGVTLNDIAHHAGVGVGTVYRRFPDKDQLIDGMFEQRVEEIVGLAQAALEDPDPWAGITGFLEAALELQARDRAIKELVLGGSGGLERVSRIRERMYPIVASLVTRARDAGVLRPDVEPQDFPILQMMLAEVIDVARDVEPELWRRFLTIVLDGLRAGRSGPTALGAPPVPLDRLPEVMAAFGPARRRSESAHATAVLTDPMNPRTSAAGSE
jgi:AcrR family transcriptional regulator